MALAKVSGSGSRTVLFVAMEMNKSFQFITLISAGPRNGQVRALTGLVTEAFMNQYKRQKDNCSGMP